MSIQSNINQTLSLASLLLTQSSTAKNRKEALSIKGRSEAAERGLADIESNIASGKFVGTPGEGGEVHETPYSEQELESIGERVKGYRSDIYDAKVSRLNPNYSKFMGEESSALRRDELLPQLDRIEKARSKALESLKGAEVQKQASKDFAKKIMEGVYSPLTDVRKGDANG